MRVQRGPLVSASITIPVALAAGMCAAIGALDASLALAGIASVTLLVLGFQLIGGFNNLLFIFLGFHLFYGLSGPVNALYAEPLTPLFSLPYETGSFLANFAYATAALAAGLFLHRAFSPARGLAPARIAVEPLLLGKVALVFAGLSTLLELSNLMRVGLTVPFEGKAAYQAAVDALVVTAPSYELAKIAIALLGLSLASSRRAKADDPSQRTGNYGKLSLLVLLPFLLLTLFLGRRGPLLDWIFIYFVAATWYESRRRINRAVGTVLVVTYLTMGMIFANRAALAYAFLVNDFSTLPARLTQPEVLVTALNPGANEFGAAFGNFSEYRKYDVDGPQFGRTYVEGFALVAPGFVYPGTKPQPVAYAFRDRFFPGVADEGAISSTAYSSILEAYVNFREAGVVLVYFLMGLVLMWLESRRRYSRSLVSALVYLSLIPSAFVFHRADFGAAVLSPVFFAMILITGTMVTLYALRSIRRPTPVTALTPHPEI